MYNWQIFSLSQNKKDFVFVILTVAAFGGRGWGEDCVRPLPKSAFCNKYQADLGIFIISDDLLYA